MLSIGRVSTSAAAVGYFCGESRGESGYYTSDEAVGRWVGRGATELGLTGQLVDADVHVFGRLLAGQDVHGRTLLGPVWRSDPAARVPAAQLVAAVAVVTAETGMSPRLLLGEQLGSAYDIAVRRLRGGVGAAGLRADVAVAMAHAAGLDAFDVHRSASVDGTEPLTPALARVGQRVDVRLPGLDLTFSAPKSVSVLAALMDDVSVWAEVQASQDRAVDAAVSWLETKASHGLRGHQGDGRRASRAATSGFVAAAFDHETSRNGDPQVHTHVVVANMVHGSDGRWSALDTRAIHRHARTAGFIYQAVLRSELTSRLGVQWGPVSRGTAEIAGVGQTVRGWFSTRRAQIEVALSNAGREGARAAQSACLATRRRKDRSTARSEIRRSWLARVPGGRQGDPARFVRSALGRQTAPLPDADREQIAWRLLGPDGLTSHGTTFDRLDLLRGICESIAPGSPASGTALEQLADGVLALPDAVQLGDGTYTTRWLLDAEAEALAAASDLRHQEVAGVPEPEIEAAIKVAGMSGEQASMVRALTGPGTGLRVVVGPPGSGKTAALRAAYRAWTAAGVPVHGVALSGLAARGLQQAAMIPTQTVASVLQQLRPGLPGPVPAGGVLVVDEAGMVGTKDLNTLLQAAQERGFALVLVGDHKQLPEINAGGLFAHLCDQPEVELTANHRQQAEWERHALADFRAGRVPAAMDALLAHERVHIHPDSTSQITSAAADYLHATATIPPERVGLLAATRAQSRALNEAVRELREAAGHLTGPTLSAVTPDGRLALRSGDRVSITSPDRERGLLNGQMGHVTAVDPQQGSAVVHIDDGRELTLGPDFLARGKLAHGYASTIHKAQGQTHQVTFIVGSPALTAETAYTALSRATSEHHLHLAPAPQQVNEAADPIAEWMTDNALAAAGRAMATSRAQTLASAQTRNTTLEYRRSPEPALPQLGRASEMSIA